MTDHNDDQLTSAQLIEKVDALVRAWSDSNRACHDVEDVDEDATELVVGWSMSVDIRTMAFDEDGDEETHTVCGHFRMEGMSNVHAAGLSRVAANYWAGI